MIVISEEDMINKGFVTCENSKIITIDKKTYNRKGENETIIIEEDEQLLESWCKQRNIRYKLV